MHKSSWTCLRLDRSPADFGEALWCNVGPFWRERTMSVVTTLLGDMEKSIAWPLGERVGIRFEKSVSPRAFVEKLLCDEGFASPEDLREVFEVPRMPLACRSLGDEVRSDSFVRMTDEPRTVLRQALILGLCGPHHYDPSKAVIWTDNRLSRQLDLFVPGRFYADN